MPAKTKLPYIFNCANCGKEVSVPPWRAARAKVCSVACRWETQRGSHCTKDAITLPDTDAAYIAGLMDGEGNIYLAYDRRGKKAHYYTLTIVNTDHAMINWLTAKIVCSYQEQRDVRSPEHPRWKRQYRWRLFCSKHVYQFLRCIEPFMITKKADAFCAMQRLVVRPGIYGS